MRKRAGLSCDGSKGNIQARYELKNGVYEGSIVKYRRSGVGIAVLDEGTIAIGQWQNDVLHGRALVIDPKFGLVLGNFSKGAQQGKQLIRLNQSPDTIYFIEVKDENKLPASFIEFSLKDGTASIIDKSKNECAETFISKSMRELLSELQNLDIKEFSHLITKKEAKGIAEIGFRRDSLLSGFAFSINLKTFDLVSAGFFEKGKLEGLGKLVLSNKDVFEGLFKDGKIAGKGFYFEAAMRCYTYGIFSEGKIQSQVNTYTSYPFVPIKKFKSAIHEGSLNYYSNTFPSHGFIRGDWSYLNQHTPLAPLSPPQSEQVIHIPSSAFSKHTPSSQPKHYDDISEEKDHQPAIVISQFPSFPQQPVSSSPPKKQFYQQLPSSIPSSSHRQLESPSPRRMKPNVQQQQQYNPNEALMLLYSNQYQTFQQQNQQQQPPSPMRDSPISYSKLSPANFQSHLTSSPLIEPPIYAPAQQNRSNSRNQVKTEGSTIPSDKYSEKYNHLFAPPKPTSSSSQVTVDFGKLSNILAPTATATASTSINTTSSLYLKNNPSRSFIQLQSESTPESKRKQVYHPTARVSTEQNRQPSANYYLVNNTLMHSSEVPKLPPPSSLSTVDSQFFPSSTANNFALNKSGNGHSYSQSERVITPSKINSNDVNHNQCQNQKINPSRVSLHSIIKQAYNNNQVAASDGSIYQISLPTSMIPRSTQPPNPSSKQISNSSHTYIPNTIKDLASPTHIESYTKTHQKTNSIPRELVLTPPKVYGGYSPAQGQNPLTPYNQGEFKQRKPIGIRDPLPISHTQIVQMSKVSDELESSPRYRLLSKDNQKRFPENINDPNWNPASNHSYQEVASEHDEGETEFVNPFQNTAAHQNLHKIPPFATGIFDLNSLFVSQEPQILNHTPNNSNNNYNMFTLSGQRNANNAQKDQQKIISVDENEPYNYRNKSVVRFSFIKERKDSLPREQSASPFNNTKIKNPEKSSLKSLQLNQACTNRTSSINLTTARTTMTEQQHLASMCNDQFRISPQRPSRKALADIEAHQNNTSRKN